VKKKLQGLVGAAKPGERTALSQDEVVRAALELLDEVGLDGLTMRGLAERLGVKAASLYWHIRDKEELIRLLDAAVGAGMRLPDPGLPWREQIELGSAEWRRALLAHRDAARLGLGRIPSDPASLAGAESLLRTLRKAGFSDRDAAAAAFLFSNYVPGFVIEETSIVSVQGASGQLPEAPLGGLARARLEITSASQLTLRSDPALTSLYQVSFEGTPPEIKLQGGTVTLSPHHGRHNSCEMRLSCAIPWEIGVRGGTHHLEADLRHLKLRGLEASGGTSDLELILGQPEGIVPLRVSGGTSKLTVHRPEGVAARVEVKGGISRLDFDQREFKGAGEMQVENPAYKGASARYNISVSGGISRLLVDTELPAEPEAATRAASPANFASVPLEEYPNLAELAALMMQPSMDERFRFGLQVILDGLERRLAKR
jgi:AcrR family transcriptional regulator